MKNMRGRWTKTSAALVAGLGLLCLSAASSQAAQTLDARDVISRIQRLERDLRDVQSETFRRNPGAAPPTAPAAPAPVPEPQAQQPLPDLDPLVRQISEMQESLGRLTGQMEELGHRVDELSQKADRMQKEIDLQNAPQATAALNTPPPGIADPPPRAADNGNALASLTPDQTAPSLRGAPPANLGQIPAGASLPVPLPRPADSKTEFDAAMNLLSRAQYDPARAAFRKFVDTHPDEDRAPDALYWAGDIAYSAKKDYPEAARDFAELLKKYPKAQRAPDGMLKLGLALFELGQMKEGCAALAALPAKYPDATQAVATRAKTERADNKCK
jgi:tol-pal system protein YbgF